MSGFAYSFFLFLLLIAACLGGQGQTGDLESTESFFQSKLREEKRNGQVEAWVETQLWRLDSLLTYDGMLASDVLLPAIDSFSWEPDKHLAALYLNLGFFALEYEQDTDLALEAYEWVYQRVGDSTLKSTPGYAIFAFRPLGNLYTRLGELQKAHIVLESALRMLKSADAPSQSNDMAETASDLAISYRHAGMNEKAEASYQEALSQDDVSPEIRSRILANYAEFQFANGHLPKAQQHLEAAIGILNANPDIPYRSLTLAGVNHILSSVMQERGDLPAACRAAEASIRFGKDFWGNQGLSREMAGYYIRQAEVLRAEENTEEALYHCQLSLSRLLPNHSLSDLDNTGNPNRYVPENRLWETFSLQGGLFYDRYRQTGNPSFLTASLDAHEAAMRVEAIQLREFAYDASSLQLLAANRKQKNEAIAVAWELWEQTSSDGHYQRALSIAERSRSLLLLDRRRQLDLMATQQADPALIAQIDQVDSLLAVAQIDLRDLDSESMQYIRQEMYLDSLVSRGQQLREQLLQLSPLYASARFGDIPFDLKSFQASLPDDVIVASYFLGEQSVFVFGIGSDRHELLKIPFPDRLSQLVDQLYQAITLPYMGQSLALGQSDSVRRSVSLALYSSLVKPVLDRLEGSRKDRLWIVPDGIVGRIPFALLLTEKPAGRYYADEPFLVKTMSLAMANNLTLLYLQLQGDPMARAVNMLCVAPSYEQVGYGTARSVGSELPVAVPEGVRLTFHLEEANYLHDRYGGGFLLRAEANPEAFQEEVGDYAVLHFSGHAQPDSATGFWNFLALEPRPGSMDAFSAFWQPEILALRLQAELVYLSACETSKGKFYQGEGHSSLARAFMYAGAQSVVATLWQIDDSVSLRFAERFYLNLEAGISKDKAMQQTMVSMIDENRPPYAWAPYLIWGDTGTIQLQEKESRLAPLVLGVVIGFAGIIVMGMVQRRRRKRSVDA